MPVIGRFLVLWVKSEVKTSVNNLKISLSSFWRMPGSPKSFFRVVVKRSPTSCNRSVSKSSTSFKTLLTIEVRELVSLKSFCKSQMVSLSTSVSRTSVLLVISVTSD